MVAGLGNIYVCEALHRARLSPKRRASTIATRKGEPNDHAVRLVEGIRAVLNDAIKAGGSSLRDHRRTDGELGLFQHNFRVYDREGAKCPTPGCKGTSGASYKPAARRSSVRCASDENPLRDGKVKMCRYRVAASAVLSHCAMAAAISLLFFSFIITWLLPLIPTSASRRKFGLTPACWRYFTVQ